MNSYERLFGAGPRGVFYGVVLLMAAATLEESTGLPGITNNAMLRHIFFGLCTAATVLVVLWSLYSLPVGDRGKELITGGAFRYFRHPLYAAFLLFFNSGLAVLMNNWIYILWALLLIPVWQWNVRAEEKLMLDKFGDAYIAYCARTRRFFPRLFRP